jgi:CheY-like chemotaxis protein
MNLVLNAQDAMPDGGYLSVSLSRIHLTEKDEILLNLAEGSYMKLEVRDTGEGIGKEVLPRIFEPFYTTKERGKGTGLGLSTVYGAVKQHGGSVDVESSSSGTIFTVLLPLVVEKLKPATSQKFCDDFRSGGETVLIVEDEPLVCELARQILISRGYKVLCCSDVEDAIALAESYEDEIHLLMSDVIMPKMKGTDLCRVIRRTRPEIRILLISGYPDVEFRQKIEAIDGAVFLKKPFTVSSLLKRVYELLESS